MIFWILFLAVSLEYALPDSLPTRQAVNAQTNARFALVAAWVLYIAWSAVGLL